ncbi:MAG: phage protein Gp27 family protein [Leptolyngbyaceae cyanobacterium]
MAQRSQYEQLPEAAQGIVDRILREGRFADYNGLVDEVNEALAEHGYEVAFARTTLWRRGKELQELIERAKDSHEAAKALAETFPDDEALVSATIARLQSMIFELSIKDGLKARDISGLARAAADLARANVTDKKYRDEVKARAAQNSERARAIAQAGGLSPDAAEEIFNLVVGVVA